VPNTLKSLPLTAAPSAGDWPILHGEAIKGSRQGRRDGRVKGLVSAALLQVAEKVERRTHAAQKGEGEDPQTASAPLADYNFMQYAVQRPRQSSPSPSSLP